MEIKVLFKKLQLLIIALPLVMLSAIPIYLEYDKYVSKREDKESSLRFYKNANQPIPYGVFNSVSTFKDSIIWELLVRNQYARKAVEMCNVSSGEPIYDIAEKYAIGVMNDHPNATQLHSAVDTAVLMMMFIELGFVPETVGSSIYGQ